MTVKKTNYVLDAFRSYQRRHGLTIAGIAAELNTTEDRTLHLRMCSYAEATDPTFHSVVKQLARYARCNAEALAVILLEAGEFNHA